MKTEMIIKGLNEAEGTINIDIHGLEPKVAININSPQCLLIAAKALISSMARLTGTSEAEATLAVISFLDDTESSVADSQEQLDVMKEIIKRGGKIDGLM